VDHFGGRINKLTNSTRLESSALVTDVPESPIRESIQGLVTTMTGFWTPCRILMANFKDHFKEK
jgi:hypothetical protein